MQRLKDLDLSKNGVGSEGGLAVAREAAKLPALRALILRWKEAGNPINEVTKAQISQMLPKLTAGNLLM